MIEAHIVKVVVVVEVGDMVPNNKHSKSSGNSKLQEDEDEAIGEDPHLGMKTIRMFSAVTITSLGTMLQIVGTKSKSKQI